MKLMISLPFYPVNELLFIVTTARRINRTSTITIAEISPNLPISSAMASNFIYKGVAIYYFLI